MKMGFFLDLANKAQLDWFKSQKFLFKICGKITEKSSGKVVGYLIVPKAFRAKRIIKKATSFLGNTVKVKI